MGGVFPISFKEIGGSDLAVRGLLQHSSDSGDPRVQAVLMHVPIPGIKKNQQKVSEFLKKRRDYSRGHSVLSQKQQSLH